MNPLNPDGHLPPSIQRAKKIAHYTDTLFTLPVIKKQVGLDPILGLLPGGGDFIMALLSGYIVWSAYELGLPRPVILKMLGNIALDWLIGTVPVLGDLFDVGWKANFRNAKLLEEAYCNLPRARYEAPEVVDIQAE